MEFYVLVLTTIIVRYSDSQVGGDGVELLSGRRSEGLEVFFFSIVE
ncbi:MAG: hypothetical protein V3S26_00845 [Acidimicrobiia bacterium]